MTLIAGHARLVNYMVQSIERLYVGLVKRLLDIPTTFDPIPIVRGTKRVLHSRRLNKALKAQCSDTVYVCVRSVISAHNGDALIE